MVVVIMLAYRYAVIAPLLILQLPIHAAAVKNQVLTYDAYIDGKHQPVTLAIEHQPSQTVVNFFNHFGDTETSIFSKQNKQIKSSYIDPQGRQSAEADYDYINKVIKVSGDYPTNHEYKEPTYDNNGAIFYLFTIIQPGMNSKITFNLCPTNLRHVTDPFLRTLVMNLVGPVEMYLKHIADEELIIDNKHYQTRKFEMGINVPALAFFWPNKYYFWYSIENPMMIRFEGYNANRHYDIYNLVGIHEEELHMPELPSL